MSRRNLAYLLGAGIALTLLTVALHRAGLAPGILGRRGTLAADMALAWLAYAAGVVCLLRLPCRIAVPLLLAGAVVIRLAALSPVAPSSDDLYRYAWDGRVQAAGIDPYRYPPAAPELAPLREGWLWPDVQTCRELERRLDTCTRINRAPERTVYPPLGQAWFRVLHEVRPEGSRDRAYQIAGFIVDLALVGLLLALLRRRDPRWAALYAWCPAAAYEAVANAHVDGLAVLLAVGAVGLLRAGRPAAAAVPLAGAVLVKLYPGVLIPLLWRRGTAGRATSVLVGLVGLAYLPHLLAVGTNVLGYLPGYLAEERYDDGGRFLLLPVPGGAATAVAMLVLGALGLLVLRLGGPPEVLAVRLVGLLLLVTTPVQPWYALLLVALAALARQWWWPAVGAAAYPLYFAAVLDEPTRLAGTASYGLAAAVVLVGIGAAARSGARAKSATPSANGTAAAKPSS